MKFVSAHQVGANESAWPAIGGSAVRIWFLGLIILMLARQVLWFISFELNEATKLDVWKRDGPPSSARMAGIFGTDYPRFITRRVVENGISSRFNGDGEELTVFCFRLRKSQR